MFASGQNQNHKFVGTTSLWLQVCGNVHSEVFSFRQSVHNPLLPFLSLAPQDDNINLGFTGNAA